MKVALRLRRQQGIDLMACFGEFHAMALINCPECGKQVSTVAQACPSCGFPVAEKVQQGEVVAQPAGGTAPDELLAEVRPSHWNFFWHWFFFFLIVPPIIALFRRASLVMRVFSNRITIERGVFSKCYQDYLPRDIRSIDIDQNFLARIVGIGDVTISTSATAEGSERLPGIPDPKGIRELILKLRGNA